MISTYDEKISAIRVRDFPIEEGNAWAFAQTEIDNHREAASSKAEDEPSNPIPLLSQDDIPASGSFEGGCQAYLLSDVGKYLHQPFAEGLCDRCHTYSYNHEAVFPPTQPATQGCTTMSLRGCDRREYYISEIMLIHTTTIHSHHQTV